jgi:hypothetical protein
VSTEDLPSSFGVAVKPMEIKDSVKKNPTIVLHIPASTFVISVKPGIFIRIKPIMPPITLAGIRMFAKNGILARQTMPTNNIMPIHENATIALIIKPSF